MVWNALLRMFIPQPSGKPIDRLFGVPEVRAVVVLAVRGRKPGKPLEAVASAVL